MRAGIIGCQRVGIEPKGAIRTVKSTYTSIIGRFKYQPQYGISVHHAAALEIGSRAMENNPPYRKSGWSACLGYRQTLFFE
jgi:hypothetical protein